MTALELRAVEKWYGDLQVIKGVDLEIAEGEFVVFVGPSGCGKSTLLRMIAGLEDISRGSVHIRGEEMTAQPPSARGLAMVFQSYALYPHMSVRENMGFSLKMAGRPASEIDEAVTEAARVLRLDSYLDRRPKDLSGGQRQRVAIGRSIVRSPTAFLFDEPLSNLDAALRVEMRQEIAKLHETLGSAMVYVTHDQVEAMTLADRIVVLRDGRIEQIGTPRDLYNAPANTFVAQFIGSPKMNLLPLDGAGGRVTLPDGGPAEGRGGIHQIGVRPEAITLCEPGQGHMDGTLDMVEYLGADSYVIVEHGGPEKVLARVPGGTDLPANGSPVGLRFAEEGLHLFDGEGLAIPMMGE